MRSGRNSWRICYTDRLLGIRVLFIARNGLGHRGFDLGVCISLVSSGVGSFRQRPSQACRCAASICRDEKKRELHDGRCDCSYRHKRCGCWLWKACISGSTTVCLLIYLDFSFDLSPLLITTHTSFVVVVVIRSGYATSLARRTLSAMMSRREASRSV